MVWRTIAAALFVMTFSMGTSFFTLPFTVSLAGFWPSMIAVLLCWIFLLITGFYYLEATLSLPKGSNVSSISRAYSSKQVRFINTVTFILTTYGYLIIFFSFSVPILNQILIRQDIVIPEVIIYAAMVLGLGWLFWMGTSAAITVNAILFVLMLYIFYQCFDAEPIPLEQSPLRKFTLGYLFIVIPSLLNSLYFQTMIPTIAYFLKNRISHIRIALAAGLSISCIIFIMWLWMVIVMTGRSSFGDINWLSPETISFDSLTKIPIIGKWLPYLLIVMLGAVTIGATLILIDFFNDLLRIPLNQRFGFKRFLIILLILVPPFLTSFIPGTSILKFMLYVADVGGLYLNGLMPVLWVWALRYVYMVDTPPLVKGGKTFLVIVAACSCFVLYLVGLEFVYNVISYSR